MINILFIVVDLSPWREARFTADKLGCGGARERLHVPPHPGARVDLPARRSR
ncbi:hypothetical protein [Halochromatium roseum]|uniref:hypothetical protein n=1 Tax=Halochromatium roseum TaxID=391920 RepID=UPI001A92C2D8|nr:hypothetical protein [Halochromatium roseum]